MFGYLRPFLASVVCGAVYLGGCSSGNLASELAEAPEFSPEGQSKCKVKASQDKPLIVEWPSAERAELEARAKNNVLIVRYDGCEMQLLGQCRAPGSYQYTAVTAKEDTVRITNADELWASIPVGAAKFEGKLATAGQLTVAMTMVGRFEVTRADLGENELTGSCDARHTRCIGSHRRCF